GAGAWLPDRGPGLDDPGWARRPDRTLVGDTLDGGQVMSARRATVLALMAVLLFVLKRHYSTADVEDLRWILWPTSTLVAFLDGSTFEFERGAGYLSRELFVVIEKSCAG